MLELIKRGAEAANYYIGKVFGAFVGATLFSSTAIILNLLIALALLAVSLTIGVILPVAAAYFSYKYTHNVYASFISTLMALGLNRLIIPPVLILGAAASVLKTIRDLFHTFSYGLVEGYTKGATNVIGQWWDTPFDFLNYLGEQRQQGRDNSWQELQETYNTFIGTSSRVSVGRGRVHRGGYSSNDYSDLDYALNQSFNHPQPDTATKKGLTETQYADLEISPTSKEFTPLTEEELRKAAAISTLTPIVDHYKDLNDRLDKYAIDDLDDELIPCMTISNPILLVKQALSKSGTWVAVPGCTKITDKTNLWYWLKNNATHPLSRDQLQDTKGSTTRYRYNAYETKSSSQELCEAAATIRTGLAASERTGYFQSFYQTFFGKSKPQDNAQDSAKQHNPSSSYKV